MQHIYFDELRKTHYIILAKKHYVKSRIKLATASSESLIVFSRDLKYVLDSRHSTAPLRRLPSKGAVVIMIVAAMAVGTWVGMRYVGTTEVTREVPEPLPGPPSPAVPDQTAHRTEYTQPERQVSKTIGSQQTVNTDPHAAERPNPEPEIEWKSYSVRRGDTLGEIFSRFSVDIGLASTIVKHKTGATLKKLLPGHRIHFGFNPGGKFVQLRYELNLLEEISIRFEDSEPIDVRKGKIPTTTRERGVTQAVGSSLFISASQAGLSDRLIMQLVAILGWEIDFSLDVRSGDRFSIIYEEMFRNGESIGTGDIIAAEFINNGAVFRAVRHIGDNGRKEYFDLKGNNLRGTFLRTPLRVSRVTSGFSKRRYHPRLKSWRSHRGVDYGARAGTPVLATGDGRVRSIGRNGGYGKTIVLKHGGRYSTLYAHLSGYKKGLKRGANVKQSEVVGYVGSTGLTTGPHLHYEFRVNGTHRNPLTYETPKAQPIPERYRDSFLSMARDRISQIADLQPEQIASR